MAKRSSKPCFVLTRRIYVSDTQFEFLNQMMANCNKIYNTGVKHYKGVVDAFRENSRYKEALEGLKNTIDEETADAWKHAICELLKEYKISEYDIHKFMGYQKSHAFKGGIHSNIVQKLGSALYKAVKSAAFKGTEIHYRKRGQTDCMEGKKADETIIYRKDTDTVTIMGKNFLLEPIREKDKYAKEAMTHNIRYCKVKREPFKSGYRYFLQIVFDGVAPKKIELGKGNCGVDEGVSTVAYYNDDHADFKVLAPDIDKYEKKIKQAAQKYERLLRLANPDCYNKDGTLKKGAKLKNRPKSVQRALMELKAAYRLKRECVKQSHGRLTNEIVSQCDTVIKEPMNYQALAKRSKKTERSDKISVVKLKRGKTKKICKFKKKKRFGKTILRRAPGLFNTLLCQKMKRYSGKVIDVNSFEYKASQYDHLSKTPKKPDLSTRTKMVGKRLVQRDLYSSYLLYNFKDINSIDFDKCKSKFRTYLKNQDKVIESVKKTGDKTKNFGLSQFLKQVS